MEFAPALLLVVLHLCGCQAVQTELFTRQTDCSNRLFADNVLMETNALSLLSCARLCVRHPSCVSFTVTPGPLSTCRAHAGVVTSMSASVSSPGAMTYAARDGESSTVTVEDTTTAGVLGVGSPYSDVSVWLGVSCVSDGDCADGQNTQCYESQCNCIPGYYFSASADSCVDSCADSDLGTRFTFYYNGNIPGSIITSRTGLGEQECFDLCLSTATPCRSIDYRPGDRACYPTSNTAMEAGWSPSTSGNHDHYQRFCV